MICRNPECDKKFEPNMHQEYCNASCRNRADYLRKRTVVEPERNCIFCKGVFPPKNRNHVFCSPDCQIAAKRSELAEEPPEQRITRLNEKGFEIWDRAHGRVA